jgi:hypothetical protein
VADVIAKRGYFAAELTLCHDEINLLDQRRALRNTIVTVSLDYTIFAASWQTRVDYLLMVLYRYCGSFFRPTGRKTRVSSGRQGIEHDRQAEVLVEKIDEHYQ